MHHIARAQEREPDSPSWVTRPLLVQSTMIDLGLCNANLAGPRDEGIDLSLGQDTPDWIRP